MPIFLILSILADHNLFGSDVEQDCSYTVFAVVFLPQLNTLRNGSFSLAEAWCAFQPIMFFF